ncbi:hypothetical protein Tco_1307717 [Tanacetum coccineum]
MVVVNDDRSLHGPAHETQIVDLVRSEKGDQGSLEVALALSGNPSEAQIQDKPLQEMSPIVVPAEVIIISDDDSDRESIDATNGDQRSLENTLEGVSINESSTIPPTKKKVVADVELLESALDEFSAQSISNMAWALPKIEGESGLRWLRLMLNSRVKLTPSSPPLPCLDENLSSFIIVLGVAVIHVQKP